MLEGVPTVFLAETRGDLGASDAIARLGKDFDADAILTAAVTRRGAKSSCACACSRAAARRSTA